MKKQTYTVLYLLCCGLRQKIIPFHPQVANIQSGFIGKHPIPGPCDPNCTLSYVTNVPARPPSNLTDSRYNLCCLTHQRYVDLTLHILPARVVRLMKLPIVVELYYVGVALCRKFFRNVMHVLVLHKRGGRKARDI